MFKQVNATFNADFGKEEDLLYHSEQIYYYLSDCIKLLDEMKISISHLAKHRAELESIKLKLGA